MVDANASNPNGTASHTRRNHFRRSRPPSWTGAEWHAAAGAEWQALSNAAS
ncbi:hypothetical protein MPRG_62690 (plasmid) [Mycobacterium paragordonae]|uniref:Uncharacterized protein n=1 Tax=Mycobacterium paragordonae TaxID=1389713 RepID=A0ABQ1CEU4_9MYCO|nr:hypothetical protein MPRG_62690 [Mycobacterium paragordonae]